jgi:hypothetical protein
VTVGFSAAIHLFECANQITKNISIIFIFTDCIYIFKDKQIVEVITGLFFFNYLLCTLRAVCTKQNSKK